MKDRKKNRWKPQSAYAEWNGTSNEGAGPVDGRNYLPVPTQ